MYISGYSCDKAKFVLARQLCTLWTRCKSLGTMQGHLVPLSVCTTNCRAATGVLKSRYFRQTKYIIIKFYGLYLYRKCQVVAPRGSTNKVAIARQKWPEESFGQSQAQRILVGVVTHWCQTLQRLALPPFPLWHVTRDMWRLKKIIHDMWQVTNDTWLVTCDMWQVPHDTWHATHDT